MFKLYIGAMWVGKTNKLLQCRQKYLDQGKSVIAIKFTADKRYLTETCEPQIVSHDNVSCRAVPATTLSQIHLMVVAYDVILIDELQFFPDGDIFVDIWASYHNKIVVATGLNSDFNREPFSVISKAMAIASKIKHLTTNGKIFTNLIATVQKPQGNILIGGEELYETCTRREYIEKKKLEDMDVKLKSNKCSLDHFKLMVASTIPNVPAMNTAHRLYNNVG